MRHFLIQVGTHSLFADRIDGFGKISPNLDGGIKATHRFPVFLSNGIQLWVHGTEAVCDEEQALLLGWLEKVSDPEDGEHPVGMSG